MGDTGQRQYEQALRSRWSYEVRPLFESAAAAGVLRSAARRASRRAAAAEAWTRAGPPEVAGQSRVEAFADGTLVIAVAEATACHYLRQQAAQLQRVLGGLLPGLRSVRFVLRSDVVDGQ